MELKPGALRFILRNGFYDWTNEIEASVQVEVIDGPRSDPVRHLTPAEFVSDMGALAGRLRFIPITILTASDGWPLNDVNDPDPAAFGIAAEPEVVPQTAWQRDEFVSTGLWVAMGLLLFFAF